MLRLNANYVFSQHAETQLAVFLTIRVGVGGGTYEPRKLRRIAYALYCRAVLQNVTPKIVTTRKIPDQWETPFQTPIHVKELKTIS